MMPSPAIHHRSNARYSCWLSAGSAQARIGALDLPAVAPPILSRYAQIARPQRRIRPCLAENRSRQSHRAQAPHARPRGEIPIAPAAPPLPHIPRFRALALFGRRPPERVDRLVIPATENLHTSRHEQIAANRSTLFDHLVGTEEKHRRHDEAERFGGLEIDYQLELCRKLNWQLARLRTLQNSIDEGSNPSPVFTQIGPIGDQGTILDRLTAGANGGQVRRQCQLRDASTLAEQHCVIGYEHDLCTYTRECLKCQFEVVGYTHLDYRSPQRPGNCGSLDAPPRHDACRARCVDEYAARCNFGQDVKSKLEQLCGKRIQRNEGSSDVTSRPSFACRQTKADGVDQSLRDDRNSGSSAFSPQSRPAWCRA